MNIEEILRVETGVLSTAKIMFNAVICGSIMMATLYAKTSDQSPKYDELDENPEVHVIRL